MQQRQGNVIVFYGRDSFMSHHYQRTFLLKNREFSCAEQVLMYSKAMLFNDIATAEAIMATNDPVEMKRLGRRVKNYDDAKWKMNRFHISMAATKAMFLQHEDLATNLIGTYPCILAEASSIDFDWGIGLPLSDPAAYDPKHWRGLNLRGEVLMCVRDFLMQSER